MTGFKCSKAVFIFNFLEVNSALNSYVIQLLCRRVLEIVCVHQQREFFNIQKVAWAWGA